MAPALPGRDELWERTEEPAPAFREAAAFEGNYVNQSSLLPASVRLLFRAKLIGLRKDPIITTIWSAQREIL